MRSKHKTSKLQSRIRKRKKMQQDKLKTKKETAENGSEDFDV